MSPGSAGILVIEKLIRYARLAVGLKPPAMECEARLRGLERIMYSKTIVPAETRRGRDALAPRRVYDPGCEQLPPSVAGLLHRYCWQTRVCGRDVRAPGVGNTEVASIIMQRLPPAVGCGAA